jgi:dihydroorotase (multifunctional complex type)
MILINNATLISSAGPRRADVLIVGECIAAVEPRIAPGDVPALLRQQAPIADVEVYDASGLLLFPGLIDAHTHMREPGGEHKEDFYTGTCAALAGGVTTVFAMPNTAPAVVDRPTFELALARARAGAVCDFGLFLGATNTNPRVAENDLALGECGLKMYMGSSTGDLLVQDFEPQYEHFLHYPRDRVIAVHTEHEPAVQYFAARGARRPPICAELETARAITLAGRCNRPAHVCHLSTRREVELVRDAKMRGAPVTCEYAPHHLFLHDEGAQPSTLNPQPPTFNLPPSAFQMNPPLREHADAQALWDNLDAADCVATDHAPHTLAEKYGPRPPSGVPGLETMLPLLLTAVDAGHPLLRLADIARLCCEGPARIYNIPGKGRIAVGYDADLTLVDPRDAWVIGDRPQFTKCGWTPFAGWPVRGSVRRTMARGRWAFADGAILARPGSGRNVVDRSAASHAGTDAGDQQPATL